MGMAYTIDTPLKVARFGISSVISIMGDSLIEEMRKFYCSSENEAYVPILKDDDDCRSRRITAYLDLVNRIVSGQMEELRSGKFEEGKEILKYFELLPVSSSLKVLFNEMMKLEDGAAKTSLQEILRKKITAGSIDVNIMTKVDKTNYFKTGEPMPAEFSDAMASLRGYANSSLSSSVVFSAGMNPRLYTYITAFSDFFPDANGCLKKKITLKVSDYRSALIQGKFLAKKGLWVSEFRVESGLNCGGHAFATAGYLLGPVMEEFKQRKEELAGELFGLCNSSLLGKGITPFSSRPVMKISVQGGIGSANENAFLLDYYNVNSTGWGSPFLLVPEATNVDDETLTQLISANKEDYYLSNTSPLGIRFNNFRKSSAEDTRNKRIENGRPGSPCYIKYLSFNTEFTEKPICTASREYQSLKIKQIMSNGYSPGEKAMQVGKVTEKECICSGLGASVFLKNGIALPNKLKPVSICPGPNLAYFSGSFSLSDMISHIYGRKNILNNLHRPHMFINELVMYVDYFQTEIHRYNGQITERHIKYLHTFKENLLKGIEYYKTLAHSILNETAVNRTGFTEALSSMGGYLKKLHIPDPARVFKLSLNPDS